MPRLRVGYIVDESDQHFIVWDAFRRSQSSQLYSIDALIVQRPYEEDKAKSKILRRIEKVRRVGVARTVGNVTFFRGIKRLESKLVARDERYRNCLTEYPLTSFDVPKLYVSPNVSTSGLVYTYCQEDIEAIEALDVDLLIRGGSGILRGEILETCPFGILSFHHADNSVNRGGPAGFWEVFNREPSTGFIIQRLLNELDGGDVMFKGSVATENLYLRNQCKLYMKSNIFLHHAIEHIARTNSAPAIHPKTPYAYPLYRTPTLFEQFAYLTRSWTRILRNRSRRMSGKALRWSVAFQFVGDWRSAALWKSTIIQNPPFRFLADPFIKVRDGRAVAFMEDYDFRTARGKISAYELKPSGYVDLGCALEEEFHLSYPYLFEDDDGCLYMCPESSENEDIRIYKCVEFPLRWELFNILMKGISAADTSICKHGGKYWLLTNLDSSSLGDHSSELHIFYADTLGSGEWTAHPGNPVVFDSRRARNGGLLIEHDAIYRVFQIQGFDMYGAAMGVAKIRQLDCENYAEDVLCEIPPRFYPAILGTHTLSFEEGVLLLDFVKVESVKR